MRGLLYFGLFFRHHLGSRIIVEINSCTAKGCVAFELFDVGFGPSSDLSEVWEWGTVVVVGIPELSWGNWGASCPWSHDGFPHVLWGIYSWGFTMRFDSSNQFSHIVTVSSIVFSPATSWARIGFNIKPNHSIEIAGDRRHQGVYLGRSWLSTAREHVDISDETSSPGVIEVIDHVDINCPVWIVSSNDGELFSIVFQASVSGGRKELTDVDSLNAQQGQDQERE